MKQVKEEAEPVARLLSADGRTIGWVYFWNNSEVSILWIDGHREATQIDPPLRPDILARAKAVTVSHVTALLEALSTNRDKDSS